MVQKRSALSENSKMQILSNDLVRRLGNTDVRQDNSEVRKVVDKFATKILTSGYSRQQTRKIVINGIRGWERKLSRATREGKDCSGLGKRAGNLESRRRQRGKTSWYKKKRCKEDNNISTEDNK